MEDLCTLARMQPDDLSIHAVSLAVLARALKDAYAGGEHPDRAVLHRAADLALAVFAEERKRYESVDSSAPLLDRIYLNAFIASGEEEDQIAPFSSPVAQRFQREMMRLLCASVADTEPAQPDCSKLRGVS